MTPVSGEPVLLPRVIGPFPGWDEDRGWVPDPDAVPFRPEDLERVEELMPERDFVKIGGVHGVGKHALARAYAQVCFNQYHHVLWVPADSSVNLAIHIVPALEALLRKLGYAPEDMYHTAWGENFLRLLTALPGQHLLIQGYERYGVTQQLKASAGQGWKQLVIGSEYISEFEMKVLEPDEGKAYFLRFFPFEGELESLDALMDFLGGHPLLIRLVAKSLAVKRQHLQSPEPMVEVDRLTKKLQHWYDTFEGLELVFEEIHYAKERIYRIHLALLHADQITGVDQVPALRRLLIQLAVLPGDYHAPASLEPVLGIEPEEGPAFLKNLDQLVALGWLETEPGNQRVSLNPILKTVVLHRLSPDWEDVERMIAAIKRHLLVEPRAEQLGPDLSWLKLAKALLDNLVGHSEWQHYLDDGQYLDPDEDVGWDAIVLKNEQRAVWELDCAMGWWILVAAHGGRDEEPAQHALKVGLRLFESGQLDALELAHTKLLAGLTARKESSWDAQPAGGYFADALAVYESVGYTDSVRYGLVLIGMGEVCNADEEWEAGVSWYLKARAWVVDHLGRQDALFGRILSRLGDAYLTGAQYAEAIASYEDLLVWCAAQPDGAPAMRRYALSDLRRACAAAGKYAAALDWQLAANQADHEKALLFDPGWTWNSEETGELLMKLERNEEAVEWLELALAEYQLEYPDPAKDTYPHDRNIRALLADLYMQQERWEAAREQIDVLYQQPDSNSGVKDTREQEYRRVLVYRKVGDFQAAVEVMQDMIRFLRQFYLAYSPELFAAREKLAEVYEEMGDMVQARKAYEEVYADKRLVLGLMHVEVVGLWERLRDLGVGEGGGFS